MTSERQTLHWEAIMRYPILLKDCLVLAAVVAVLFAESVVVSATVPVDRTPGTQETAQRASAASPTKTPETRGIRNSAEARAARAYDAAVHEGPLGVQAFLAEFPKGADLHFHLGAGVYAETLIRVAGEDKVCIDPMGPKFARNEKGEAIKEPCASPLVAASSLGGSSLTPAQQDFYDRVIDAFSMRNFVPTSGYSGHDQFFSTFDRFGLDKSHTGQWIDEITQRSAAENNQYLELMMTPSFGHAAKIAREVGWNADLAQMRQTLLDR